MKNVKEVYDEIGSWLKKQDIKKIKFLCEQDCYDSESDLGKLQRMVNYYNNINEHKTQFNYIFGEKLISIKEIGKYMIDKMGDYGPKKGKSKKDFDEDRRDSGYADTEMFKEIKSFWKSLDEDKIMSVISGSVSDDYEIDLDGYRCYFLSRSNVHPLLFNYVYYSSKKSVEELEEELFNSNDSYEEIESFYPPKELFLPDSDAMNKLYINKFSENSKKNLEDFNSFIKNILRNEKLKEEPMLKDKMEELKKLIS